MGGQAYSRHPHGDHEKRHCSAFYVLLVHQNHSHSQCTIYAIQNQYSILGKFLKFNKAKVMLDSILQSLLNKPKMQDISTKNAQYHNQSSQMPNCKKIQSKAFICFKIKITQFNLKAIKMYLEIGSAHKFREGIHSH